MAFPYLLVFSIISSSPLILVFGNKPPGLVEYVDSPEEGLNMEARGPPGCHVTCRFCLSSDYIYSMKRPLHIKIIVAAEVFPSISSRPARRCKDLNTDNTRCSDPSKWSTNAFGTKIYSFYSFYSDGIL